MFQAGTAPARCSLAAAFLLVLAACGGGGGGSGKSSAPPDADADTVADSTDCAPNDAGRWQLLPYQSVDGDGDGHRANTAGQLCSGAALSSAYSATAVTAGEADCDDANAGAWQSLGYVARDADADGLAVPENGEICSAQTLPAGYGAVTPAPAVVDCDDASGSSWRYMAIYRDADGDGVGAGSSASTCIGSGAPVGFSLYGYDPIDDPGDPDAATTSDVELQVWMRFPP